MTEPIWTDPQPTFKEPSSLKSSGLTPSIVTGTLLRLIQYHFSDPENIHDDKLKDYVWVDDRLSGNTIESPITIRYGYHVDARAIQQRPSILIRRGPMSHQKLPLRGKAINHMEKNGNYRGEDYLAPLNAHHLITCVAKGAFAADRLAEEVFFRLLEFAPSIRKDLCINEFEVMRMASPQRIDEDNENYRVDIQCDWTYVHSWTLVPIAPILKKVQVRDTVSQNIDDV
jgi:hypothetical protein